MLEKISGEFEYTITKLNWINAQHTYFFHTSYFTVEITNRWGDIDFCFHSASDNEEFSPCLYFTIRIFKCMVKDLEELLIPYFKKLVEDSSK
jgi:hypothetical protein